MTYDVPFASPDFVIDVLDVVWVVVAGTVVIVYKVAPVDAVHETSIVFRPMLLKVRFVGAAGRV